jgi:hypothetical protein
MLGGCLRPCAPTANSFPAEGASPRPIPRLPVVIIAAAICETINPCPPCPPVRRSPDDRAEDQVKTCPRCKHPWPLTPEYWHLNSRAKTGFQGWCRLCVVAHAREVQAANGSVLRQLKESHPCADCGLHFAAYVMTFSQRPGETGGADISRMASHNRRWPAIEAEIAARDIVCFTVTATASAAGDQLGSRAGSAGPGTPW